MAEPGRIGRLFGGGLANLGKLPAIAALACLPAAAALAAQDAAEATADFPWYQVEVLLFLDESPRSDTPEDLLVEDDPAYSGRLLELAPPLGEPVRPRTVGELRALLSDVDAQPRVQIVPAGMNPELLRLFDWLERLDGAGLSTGFEGLRDLEFLDIYAVAWVDVPDTGEPAPVDTGPLLPPIEPIEVPDIEKRVFIPSDAVIPIPMRLAFRDVPVDERLLQDEARRLRRAQGYRVIGWLAWRQPFEREAPPFDIMVSWLDPDGERRVDGTIGLDLRRFLHAGIDLWLQEPLPLEALPDADGDGFHDDTGADLFGPGSERLRTAVVHVRGSRRMRSGETHYIDHPRVGVLIRAEPFELDAPLPDTDSAPPAAQ